MKRKEKEHLKADPFVNFFENALAFLKNNRTMILAMAGTLLLAIIALFIIGFFTNLSIAGENEVYASAFTIRNNAAMSIDQKIAKLKELKFKKGISSVGWLFITALHYEKGDLANAAKTLQQFPGSRIALINDQKKMLEAQVLAAGGKSQEALNLLSTLLNDKKTQMGKELILLMMAKLQSKNLRQAEAVANLKRIISEFPNTPSANEAQTLLSASEAADSTAQ